MEAIGRVRRVSQHSPVRNDPNEFHLVENVMSVGIAYSRLTRWATTQAWAFSSRTGTELSDEDAVVMTRSGPGNDRPALSVVPVRRRLTLRLN